MKTPENIKMGLKRCYKAGSCLEDCPYGKLDFPECVIVKCDDAIAYIQQLESDNAQLHRCIENLTDKLNAANDALPRWISVKERMPEGEVLAADFAPGTYGYMDYIIGYVFPEKFAGPEGCYAENDHEILHHVTHWMPLPEEPKEE